MEPVMFHHEKTRHNISVDIRIFLVCRPPNFIKYLTIIKILISCELGCKCAVN